MLGNYIHSKGALGFVTKMEFPLEIFVRSKAMIRERNISMTSGQFLQSATIISDKAKVEPGSSQL